MPFLLEKDNGLRSLRVADHATRQQIRRQWVLLRLHRSLVTADVHCQTMLVDSLARSLNFSEFIRGFISNMILQLAF